MILLDGNQLTLDMLSRIAHDGERVGISDEARARVSASRAVVDAAAARGTPAYGINTGFGALADVAIPADQLAALQLNLLRSHAAGVGDPLPTPAVRALTALRANVLAKGFSGIRLETLDALVALLNARVHPRVPSRGSVGASGDLAPLAHLALVVVGEGEAEHEGAQLSGAAALARAGLRPVTLAAKEGLALINGTQASAAVLALAVLASARLARAADIAAAMSVDALRGSFHPFEARIHAARPVPGQAASAANLLTLGAGSAINASHQNCGKVQDAYALRCAPQVHGSAREAIAFAHRLARSRPIPPRTIRWSLPSAATSSRAATSMARRSRLAADTLTIGLVATRVDQRATHRSTHDAARERLAAFLVRDSGLNSGFMMAHVTAAALTSELKTLAHPAVGRLDSDIGGPRGPCEHEHVGRAQGLARARPGDARNRHRIDGGVPGPSTCWRRCASSPRLQNVHQSVRATCRGFRPIARRQPDVAAIVHLIASGAIDTAAGDLA
jgi:histidine ammonia-lyase